VSILQQHGTRCAVELYMLLVGSSTRSGR